MNNKNIIILIAVVILIIIFGGITLVSSSTSSPQAFISQNVRAETIEATSFDWGNISISGGDVTKSFTIKNTGTEVLKLFNIKTSCHCTEANITIDGKTSQNFGMSGVSDWIGVVQPGKEARLTVIFDPAYHGPQGVGPVTRFVSVDTNDRGNDKITYTLTGTIVN
jgi:hypothetical protein